VANFKEQYQGLWNHLIGKADKAAELAVGGDFDAVGKLEFALLRSLGLKPNHTVVDVGCGSGRLAIHLAKWLSGQYYGSDILEPLLGHAKSLCERPDWHFTRTDGETIPVPDGAADYVCFFSVLTHINHEDSWRYILEAKRVLKPGGKIVCSFLEFKIRGCWAIFREDVKDRSPNKVLNQFLSRDALEAFAYNAGLRILSFFDGDKPHFPIEGEILFENGHRVSDMGNLGQSICVIEKPIEPLPLPL
jgi:ubiquinone/menaquinone biosynthesis C-methylase UbiE